MRGFMEVTEQSPPPALVPCHRDRGASEVSSNSHILHISSPGGGPSRAARCDDLHSTQTEEVT